MDKNGLLTKIGNNHFPCGTSKRYEVDDMKYYLAIDIGASSGRHILGWHEDERVKTREIYRFHNGVEHLDGHLVWNIDALLQHVKRGISTALSAVDKVSESSRIASLSIDTWGVDYVLMSGDKEVSPVYAYRDSRTEIVIPKVHALLPFDTLYERTGCQFQSFNSIYQLYADKEGGRLNGVTDFLMIPEYLLYKLCGVKTKEYTNATTTGMINAKTGTFDPFLYETLGLPKELFPSPVQPGRILGEYKGIRCMLGATHDTASAVEGIPMEGNHPYISSGTWSLLGVKTPRPLTDKASQAANYSNEGGVGYNRYQKNIMGMWLVNGLKKEIADELEFAHLVDLARRSRCDLLVDANNPEFLAPGSMKAAFDNVTNGKLHNIGDYFRCAYRSLAQNYAKALTELETNTGTKYEKLYIVGGGAKNAFLNEETETATKKQVIAPPIEATALGNLKMQMEADK